MHPHFTQVTLFTDSDGRARFRESTIGPTGLRRSCRPPLGIKGDSKACGLPSVRPIGDSRKRARPSLSVNSVTWVKLAAGKVMAGDFRAWR